MTEHRRDCFRLTDDVRCSIATRLQSSEGSEAREAKICHEWLRWQFDGMAQPTAGSTNGSYYNVSNGWDTFETHILYARSS